MTQRDHDAPRFEWQSLLADYPPQVASLSAQREMSYRCAGQLLDDHPNDQPVVIFLHGIGSSSGSWCYQFKSLSTRCALYAWDMPGYARSTRSAHPHVDDYAATLRVWMDALSITSAVIVGHSLGALIAARFTVQCAGRVRGLLLTDPAAGHKALPEDESAKRFDARMQRFTQMDAASHATARAPAMLTTNATPEALSLVEYSLMQLQLPGYTDAAQLLRDGDITTDLMQINQGNRRVPIMMLCGSDDTVTPPDGVRALADSLSPPCDYVEVANAGHASQVDAPQEFNRVLLQYLSQCHV